RVQLNKQEEKALVADLSDDMVGLGPLEPYVAQYVQKFYFILAGSAFEWRYTHHLIILTLWD
ncbi:MAG TPA: hypothetical protein VE687_00515, partial [Stellaceae bacterium]|nr:hypothetical protein [Stellaceae bacterium]